MVGEGVKLPIGGRVALDRRRLLDLIDQMRVAVPPQLREAQEVLANKEEVLAEGREEAQLAIARAQQEAEERLGEMELVKAAQARSEELVRQADEKAQELLTEAEERLKSRLSQADALAAQQMDEADRYALEILKKLEVQLSSFLGSVRSGIDAMENRPPSEP